jgi:hypothetical protein
MAFKASNDVLTEKMSTAADQQVRDEIDKLLDKKLLLTLGKFVADEKDVSSLLADENIKANFDQLRSHVAAAISLHEDAISMWVKAKMQTKSQS